MLSHLQSLFNCFEIALYFFSCQPNHLIFAFLLGFVILSCFLEKFGLVLRMVRPSETIHAGRVESGTTRRRFQASSRQLTSNSRYRDPLFTAKFSKTNSLYTKDSTGGQKCYSFEKLTGTVFPSKLSRVTLP